MRRIIPITTYHTCVDVRIVDNVRGCAKRIYKHHNEEIEPDDYKADYRGYFCCFDDDRYYLILKSSTLTHGVIAHEIDHVVREIQKHNNLAGDEDTAYLCEQITDGVYRLLYDKGVQITAY